MHAPLLSASSSSPSHIEGESWVFTQHPLPMRLVKWRAEGASLGDDEALVEMACATVCGSDAHTIDGKRTDPAAPLCLGHEGCGLIAALGSRPPSVTTIDEATGATLSRPAELGDRVTWGVATSCGTESCAACAVWGLPQKCPHGHKYGHAPWRDEGPPALSSGRVDIPLSNLSGTYSSHVLLTRGTCIVVLPPSLPDAVAAPINCALATAVAAVMGSRHSSGSSGLQAAWVQGAGLVGLLCVALLKHKLRVPCVIATDVSASRLRDAVAFGADGVVCVGDSGSADAAASGDVSSRVAACAMGDLRGKTTHLLPLPGTPFDLVVEACGSPAVVPGGIAAARPGAEYVLVGMVHPASSLQGVTGESIIRKCLTVRGVHNYTPQDLVAAVAFLSRHAASLPFSSLVSSPVPLSLLVEEGLPLARGGAHARVAIDCGFGGGP